MISNRHMGAINWVGLGTLYSKECRRFLKVWLQTILAPTVTSILFLIVFTLAIGQSMLEIGGVSFVEFMAPGLIVMAMMQNSFANTSSSLMISKVQGNVVDVLMPPLSPSELLIGFSMGGVSRGLVVALVLSLVISPFVSLNIHNFGFLIFHAIGASLLLSLLGLITAIWAEKFDQLAAVTNFCITPLAFLSGTFYSVQRLPEPLLTISQFNPFFYLIDGFRYGMIGHSDGSLQLGIIVIFGCVLFMWLICYRILMKGYRLKA